MYTTAHTNCEYVCDGSEEPHYTYRSNGCGCCSEQEFLPKEELLIQLNKELIKIKNMIAKITNEELKHSEHCFED